MVSALLRSVSTTFVMIAAGDPAAQAVPSTSGASVQPPLAGLQTPSAQGVSTSEQSGPGEQGSMVVVVVLVVVVDCVVEVVVVVGPSSTSQLPWAWPSSKRSQSASRPSAAATRRQARQRSAFSTQGTKFAVVSAAPAQAPANDVARKPPDPPPQRLVTI